MTSGGAARRLKRWSVLAVLAGTVLRPGVARSQIVPDSPPALGPVNGVAIQPGTVVYQLSLARAGQEMALGTRTVEVTSANAGGGDGWLIAEQRFGTAVPTTDSLWVARADLAPVRWIASIDRAQLAASFTRDSVYGAVQSYQGRSSFSAPANASTLVTRGMVDRVVELLPLAEGFRAGVRLLVLDHGKPTIVAGELRVERVERVSWPTGEAECWVVSLRAGAAEERRWVRRQDPRVVRSERMVDGGVLTSVLIR